MYSKFEEDLNIFVTDGSTVNGVYLSERLIKMKKRLCKERFDYTIIARIYTNTIRCVSNHTPAILNFEGKYFKISFHSLSK